jgi:hypothetical protein
MPLPNFMSRSLILTIALVLFASASVLIYVHRDAPYLEHGSVNVRKAERFWGTEIERTGVSAAAEELKLRGENLPLSQSHELAHAFGSALYAVSGVTELYACPAEFSQGCAHQLIGEAIVEKGPEVIEDLFSACEKAGTSIHVCHHSVGHGIIGHFGYDSAALVHSLALCRSYGLDTRSSCVDGVFMEYFLRFLAETESGASAVRPLDPARPYAPCDSLADEYRAACAFELPRRKLYSEEASTPLVQRFSNLGAYCDAIPAPLDRPCFEGVGALAIIETKVDKDEAFGLCNAAEQGNGYIFCTTGIVLHLHYWSAPGYERVCDEAGLTGSALAYCREFAATDVEKVGSLPLPSLE